MPLPTYTKHPWTEAYSEIIDVRSPSEFAEDHIPGAINLPVLDDAERAEVGTIYKQVSPFTARKIGAALVTKNISLHLSQHFADKGKDYHPLIYCWRGGQRSGSMAWLLGQIGWRVTVVEGGYKTYRTYVRHSLEELPLNFTYQILRGKTGTGKTHILRQMGKLGAQFLDLENLANHRGSLLGEEWNHQPLPQPSQKYFESLLLQKLQSFNPEELVWVESESNKIGRVYLPKSLWEKMKHSQCVGIELPMASRVNFLLQEYPHLITNPDILKLKLERLKSLYGWEKIKTWYQLIDNQQWAYLFQGLLEYHYDPTYKYSMQRDFPKLTKIISIPDLSENRIASLVESLISRS